MGLSYILSSNFMLISCLRQNRTMNYFITFFLLIFSLSAFSSEESALLEENDFQKLSIEMKEKSLGLVLMLHADQCPYCRLMEREILSPMVKSQEYDAKVFIRKFQIDLHEDIIDFSGEKIKPSDFSARYEVSLTPTLVFLNDKGEQVVEKMIGINTVELFGAYLDIEVDKLSEKIKKTNSSH